MSALAALRSALPALLLVLAAPAARAHAAPTQPPADLVIRHVAIVDVTGGPTRRDQRIAIRGERIVAIAPESADPPSAHRIVDGHGAFVIPGLWDMHTHVTFYPGLQGDDVRAATLPLYIANGVVGVRDMGTPDLDALVRLRDDITRGRVLGPRLVISGPQLDGPAATDWTKRRILSPNHGRAVVRELVAAGADFIKVYDRLPKDAYLAIADECHRLGVTMAGHLPLAVSPFEAAEAGQRSIEHMGPGRLREACYGYLADGVAPPADSDPSQTAMLKRVIDRVFDGDAAEETWTPGTLEWLRSNMGRGMVATLGSEFGAVDSVTVLRRAVSDSGTQVCLRAQHAHGIRTYKFMIGKDGRIDWLPDEPDVLDQARTQALARSLVEHRVWITPTLWVLKAVSIRDQLTRDPDPLLAYLTRGVQVQMQPVHDSRYSAWTPVEWSWARRVYERDATLAGTLHRAGVHVLAGTDAVTDDCVPGFALHKELALLVAAGLTPLEALQAATLEPAEYLGRRAEMGTVETGKLADLVLLAADPLTDIRHTDTIAAVVRGGRFLDRAELDAMLQGVRQLVGSR